MDDSAVATGPSKSFAEYLRETPPTPLPAWVKAALWAVAVLAALLFAAAIWRLVTRPTPQARRPASSSPRRSEILRRPPAAPMIADALITTPYDQEMRR